MARLIDADMFLKNNKELADCDFIHPKYCDTLRDLVNNAPTVDVLEKIRAEVEKVFCMSVVTNELRTPMAVKTEILQIIDRYMKGDKG